MQIRDGFLHHCLTLCKQNQVYFPIAFAKFDADIVEKGMPPGKPKNIDKMDHNRYTGTWAYNDRKSVCAHAQAWLKVLQKTNYGFSKKANMENWIYERFARNDFKMVTAVEPNLYVVNRKNQCTNLQPFPVEFEKCVKAKSEHYGSKIALGILYITETMSKQVIT